MFPVPVEDTGDGTFLKQDKAMIFMRYIRMQLEVIAKELKAEYEQKTVKEILDENGLDSANAKEILDFGTRMQREKGESLNR